MNAKKKDLTVLNFTAIEYNLLDPKEFVEELAPRVSDGHALDVLIDLVQAGTIVIGDPEVLMNWTYKAVVVEGLDPKVVKEISGKKTPVVTMSLAEFEALSPKHMGNFFRWYTTPSRAAKILLEIIKTQGYLPSAEKVVQLTNGRVAVAGVERPKQNKKAPASILLKGVTINNGDALNA